MAMLNCKKVNGVADACRAKIICYPARQLVLLASERLVRHFRGCSRALTARFFITSERLLRPTKKMSLNVSYASLPDILARSDVVSLNCPLTQETRGLINRAALEQMKQTAILVNVARGGVVVEDDLIWALNNRRILAAAMDVFETEPLPGDSPLLRTEHLVVTPHLAAIAADNFAPMLNQMFDNMVRVSKGPAGAGQG